MSAFRQLPFLSHYAKRGDLNGHDIESFARPEKFETKIPKKVQESNFIFQNCFRKKIEVGISLVFSYMICTYVSVKIGKKI